MLRDIGEIRSDISKIFIYLQYGQMIQTVLMYTKSTYWIIFEVMNELHRENITSMNFNMDRSRIKLLDKISVMEIKDQRYLNPEHEKKILEYKVKPGKNEENYIDSRDRRRKLMKDVNGNYNYLPILCEIHNNPDFSDPNVMSCHFAHNQNEIDFHSLYYKTFYCRDKQCKKEQLCPKAHNMGEDFRRIYDFKNKDIIQLTVKLEDSELFKNSLLNYYDLIPTPTSFSLDTFKVTKCRMTGYCGQDPHTCLNYHDAKERRRPPKLSQYVNEVCSYVKPDRNSDFYPHLCPSVKSY